jgi:(+)-trans-carveol dehydrogenase
VAFVTGAARGQGRSHALRLAEEGADIIAVDLCDQIDTVEFAMSKPEDLEETVRAVEALDRRIVAEVADVRDQGALDAVVQRGLSEFGRLDIVSANAGITGVAPTWEIKEKEWQDMLDVNLTGVWHTVKAALPSMIEAGNGGSIVLTSSLCGIQGLENVAHYTAAKHGVIGLMRTLANEVGRHKIRVNSVLPGNVATPMILNDVVYELFCPDVDNPGRADVEPINKEFTSMDVAYMEPRDISNAILWLSSDEARYVTGVALSVDAGWANK